MKQGPRIAIDFGTTRTKVAYYDVDREQARLIELGIVHRENIPSVFYIPKIGEGEILVGDDAMAQLDVDPAGIVREIKREIDKLGKKRVGPSRLGATRVELAAEMLRMIRQRCENGVFHGQQITQCTLTVPVTYTEGQRNKLVEAANQAGFVDVRLLDEPTAAARAWLEHQGEKLGDYVVVVDIGGGTTDFSVVEWSNNRFVSSASVVPEGFNLGGNDIDDQACSELLDRLTEDDEQGILQFRDSFLVKLRGVKEQFARGLKIQRVASGKTTINIESSIFHLAESEFVTRLADELKQFIEKCSRAGIDSPIVILVGGASRISGLISTVESICSGKVYSWESADYATVLGAVEFPGEHFASVTGRDHKARLTYSEALKAAIADGKLSLSASKYLQARRIELGLLENIAQELEIQFLGETLVSMKTINTVESPIVAADVSLLEQIENYVHSGKFENALEILQIELDRNPNTPDYLAEKASILYATAKWKLALSAANAALNLCPDLAGTLYISARCSFILGDLDTAKAGFHRLLLLDENFFSKSCYWLSSIAYQKSDFLEFIAIIDRISENSFPGLKNAQVFAAKLIWCDVCISNQDTEKSVALLEQIIREKSTFGEPELEKAIKTVGDLAGTKREAVFTRFGIKVNLAESTNFDRFADLLFAVHKTNKSGAVAARGFVCSCAFSGLPISAIRPFVDRESLEAAFYEAVQLTIEDRLHQSDIHWLLDCLLECDNVDIIKIRNDDDIKRFRSLIQKLTPKLLVEKEHGIINNFVRVTNKSPFIVNDVSIVATIVRSDGSRSQFSKVVKKLASNESKEWPNAFAEPGFFGGNLSSVTVNAICKESVSNQNHTNVKNPESDGIGNEQKWEEYNTQWQGLGSTARRAQSANREPKQAVSSHSTASNKPPEKSDGGWGIFWGIIVVLGAFLGVGPLAFIVKGCQ